jgi:hypothetical protein
MAEQPIHAKQIVFVAAVLAAVVGVHLTLKVDDERTPVGNTGEGALVSGDSADELDPTNLEKRVKDNTRMLLSDSAADRMEAARTFALLLAEDENRERVLDLPADVVARMESAISEGKADPVQAVRENCRTAWMHLHVSSPAPSELP